MAEKEIGEPVKIGGMNMGRSPLVIVLAVFMFIGIPVGTFYFNYQKNARTEGDRSEKQIAEATARTLLVERHDRDIATNKSTSTENYASINDIEQRLTSLESFQTDAEGRLARAETTIEDNTEAQKAQRQRALVREGDRKVRDKRIASNTARVAEIERLLDEAKNKETSEYRASTKRLQLERQELLLEIERLKRDLGDAPN